MNKTYIVTSCLPAPGKIFSTSVIVSLTKFTENNA